VHHLPPIIHFMINPTFFRAISVVVEERSVFLP
jgi:hypothetical protein